MNTKFEYCYDEKWPVTLVFEGELNDEELIAILDKCATITGIDDGKFFPEQVGLFSVLRRGRLVSQDGNSQEFFDTGTRVPTYHVITSIESTEAPPSFMLQLNDHGMPQLVKLSAQNLVSRFQEVTWDSRAASALAWGPDEDDEDEDEYDEDEDEYDEDEDEDEYDEDEDEDEDGKPTASLGREHICEGLHKLLQENSEWRGKLFVELNSNVDPESYLRFYWTMEIPTPRRLSAIVEEMHESGIDCEIVENYKQLMVWALGGDYVCLNVGSTEFYHPDLTRYKRDGSEPLAGMRVDMHGRKKEA